MSSQTILPRILQVGENASGAVAGIIQSLSCRRPIIITDKMMVQLGYAQKIVEVLRAEGMDAEVFDDTVPEPTVSSIQAGVDRVRDGDFDCIIALGGGSPIDSAKAIAILARYGGVRPDP